MLPTLQHALNVLRHNLPHALNLALRSTQRILLARLRAALLQHQLLQRAIEARAPVRRQVGEIRVDGVELGEEFLLQVRQEAKGNALAEIALGDDEEGEAAGGGRGGGEVGGGLDEAVDEELGLVDGLVRGGGVGEAREDERDERGGVGGGAGCVLGEDGGVVRYASTGNAC